jgi:nucleotidyltransferase/DNA polymerase involved in DNA repair
MITCVLVPHFAAQLARRAQSIPDQVPLLLRSGEKVMASCECAAARGVSFGMSVRQATWLCPDARLLPVNPAQLRQTSGQVVQQLSQFTHLVEASGVIYKDKARLAPFLDSRQSAAFYVDLERLVADQSIQLGRMMGVTVRQTLGIEAACGLGAGKFPAYAAAVGAHSGHLRVVAPGEEAAFLAPLSITLLPMKQETRRRLLLLGLETIGALAALSLSAAMTQAGREGVLLHQLARGLDPRRVIPAAPQVVERVTRTFEVPLVDRGVVEAILRSMATELSVRLQSSGSMGRTLSLSFTLDDQSRLSQKTTLRTPAASSRYLADHLLRLLARLGVSSGVCSAEVLLTDLVPFAGQQLELFPDPPRPRERLQQRLAGVLARPDAPPCYWITVQDPTARQIEQRYTLERITV